jgi:Condensation domain
MTTPRQDRRGLRPALSHLARYAYSQTSWSHYLGAVTLTAHLQGALDIPALAAALNGVCARHDALRISFEENDQVLTMNVASETSLELNRIAVPPGAAGSLDRAIADLRARLAEPIDVRCSPPARAYLHELAADNHLFTLMVDHRLCDGSGMELLTEDIELLYRYHSGRLGQPPEPPLGQYTQWVDRQNEYFSPDRLELMIEWWRARLGNDPEVARVRLPGFADASEVPTRATAARIPLIRSAALRSLGQAAGVSLFSAAVAVLGRALARAAAVPAVLVNTLIVNPEATLSRIVGACSTPIAILVVDQPELSIVASCQQVQEALAESFQDEVQIPPRLLYKRLWPDFDFFAQPRMFIQPSYQWGHAFKLAGLTSTPVEPSGEGGTTNNLEINLDFGAEPIVVLAEYPDQPACADSSYQLVTVHADRILADFERSPG